MISLSQLYKTRPSELIGINKSDPYLAYCFDEALAYMAKEMEEIDPVFDEDKEEHHYTSFTEMYAKYDVKG